MKPIDTSYTRQAAERSARLEDVRDRAAAASPIASTASAPPARILGLHGSVAAIAIAAALQTRS